MRRIVDWVLLIAVVGTTGYLAYAHQDIVRSFAGEIQAKVAPCKGPVTYNIGSIDPRFHIERSTFVADIKAAEAVWEKPSGKKLFQYNASGGAVRVSLVYDARQAATDKLAAYGIQVKQSESSYESLKASYDSLAAVVDSEKTALEQGVATYKSNQAAFNAQVERSNQRGGASPAEYAQLQQELATLKAQASDLQAAQSKVSGDIDELNALATSLNLLITRLNLNVEKYNEAGSVGSAFEEGLYQSDVTGQKVDIYEYQTQTELIRVLAHEMGHALGLNHVSDPQAIMYKINQGENLKATSDDLKELKRVCSSGIL